MSAVGVEAGNNDTCARDLQPPDSKTKAKRSLSHPGTLCEFSLFWFEHSAVLAQIRTMFSGPRESLVRDAGTMAEAEEGLLAPWNRPGGATDARWSPQLMSLNPISPEDSPAPVRLCGVPSTQDHPHL